MNSNANAYAFKPLSENPIKIDLSRCRYLGELHLLLKEKFGLPEYYGENWDALWDCMDGRFGDCDEVIIEVSGYNEMNEELQTGCRTMLEIFEEVEAKTPHVHFLYFP